MMDTDRANDIMDTDRANDQQVQSCLHVQTHKPDHARHGYRYTHTHTHTQRERERDVDIGTNIETA